MRRGIVDPRALCSKQQLILDQLDWILPNHAGLREAETARKRGSLGLGGRLENA